MHILCKFFYYLFDIYFLFRDNNHMAKVSYHTEMDLKNQKKIMQELSFFPGYVQDFIISIENNTSSLTRVNYLADLKLFFTYLANNLSKSPKEITLSDLDSIKARDIVRFLSYVSYFERDGKVHINKEKGKVGS